MKSSTTHAASGGDAARCPRPVMVPRIPTPLALEAVIAQHTNLVFRSLRRAGLDTASAEDGAQQVFMVAARKIASIESGKERAFLYATAKNVAARHRRSSSRRGEVALGDDRADTLASDTPMLDELLDRRRARVLLDEILSAMPEKLSDVFVLSEIEELSASAVADILSIPVGTVASRLLRARAAFDEALVRLKRRERRGPPKESLS